MGRAGFLGVAMGGLPSIETDGLKAVAARNVEDQPVSDPSLIPSMAASVITCATGSAKSKRQSQTLPRVLPDAGPKLCARSSPVRAHLGTRGRSRTGDHTDQLSGFEVMKRHQPMRRSSEHTTPIRSRPGRYDRREVAAVFVLEGCAHAEARGDMIHSELTGFAMNSGCEDITDISTPAHHALHDKRVHRHLGGTGCDRLRICASFGHDPGRCRRARGHALVVEGVCRKPILTSIRGIPVHGAANDPMNLVSAFMALHHQTMSATANFL